MQTPLNRRDRPCVCPQAEKLLLQLRTDTRSVPTKDETIPSYFDLLQQLALPEEERIVKITAIPKNSPK